MNAAHIATVGELRSAVDAGDITELIADVGQGFRVVFGHYPSEDELAIWSVSLPAFIRALPSSLDPIPGMLELRMPIGNERADLVLLGGQGAQRVLVVELKHWAGTVQAYDVSPNLVRLGGEGGILRPHPAYQAAGYVGKLSHYHSVGKDCEIRSLSFLDSLRASTELREMMRGYESPVFFQDDVNALVEYISSFLLPSARSLEDAEHFSEGEYTVSARLVEFVRANQRAIEERIYAQLAAEGFSLCDEQLEAVAAILAAAREAATARRKGREPPKRTFMVNGPPGSGKTLVALTLLIESLGQGISALYGLRRNGALVTTLRGALHGDLAGSVYYINVPRNNTGIADSRFKARDLDLVICDEAQRMLEDSIRIIHARAPVSAFFVDETQRLNMDEEGTERNFLNTASVVGSQFKRLTDLPAGVRCRGGVAYHRFVETLLGAPNRLPMGVLNDAPWGKAYRFKVFGSYSEFMNALREAKERERMKVALVASWTESDGDSRWRLTDRPGTSATNVRVGPKLQSGRKLYADGTPIVSWVMNPEDYRTFWSGVSSDLDVCASIYGSQGFETDTVGFVWGSDLVWDHQHRTWALGGRNTSYDYSAGTNRRMSIKSLMNEVDRDTKHRRYNEVKSLLLNRARIFLTRGILDTFVYAEDEATRRFLLSLQGQR